MSTSTAAESGTAGAPLSVRTIVVGVDASDGGRAALRWAAYEAQAHDARLVVVHAYQALSTAYPYATVDAGVLRDKIEAEAETAAREDLESALASVPELEGLRVESQVRRGRAAEVILDVAEEAQLIVVGTRGLGGFRGLLLGSVGQHIIAHAAVPVMVVPPS